MRLSTLWQQISSSSLMYKLREGVLERSSHILEILKLYFYSNSPFVLHWLQKVNLNLNPAHPSPHLRVNPSLRLGLRVCQALPL